MNVTKLTYNAQISWAESTRVVYWVWAGHGGDYSPNTVDLYFLYEHQLLKEGFGRKL